MPDTLSNLLFHVVFSTHGRTPSIPAKIRPSLHAYLGGVVREQGGVALEVGGVADHVHALVRLPPRLPVSDLVRKMKASSSRWMNGREPRHRFRWQTGYAAFSVSESKVAALRRYIRCQEEHHCRRDFGAEFQALLRVHGLSESRP